VVVPFFIALTILTVFLIKDPIVVKRGSLDISGATSLGIGIFSLLLGLTQGQEWGWTSPLILGLFALALLMFAVFTWLELKTRDPIVRLSMFRNRGVLDASVTAIFIGFCMFLLFQTLPFFLETPKAAGGFFGISDTFVIGLYMFPSAIAQLIFGPMGGILSKKVGADKVLIAGLAIMSLGFATLVFLHSDWVGIVISVFIAGAGMALCMVSMINLVVVTCKQSEFGVASGMNTLFRVVGGAVGPVLAVVILSNYSQIIAGHPVYSESGYVATWIVGVIFSLIGLACAVLLRPKKGDMECDIAPQDLRPSESQRRKRRVNRRSARPGNSSGPLGQGLGIFPCLDQGIEAAAGAFMPKAQLIRELLGKTFKMFTLGHTGIDVKAP
jgi:predicted MFS family arabinose efflux permease